MKPIQYHQQDNLCLLHGDFAHTILYFIVHAGSNDDPPGRAGTAHLAEHLNLSCRNTGKLPLCYNSSGLTCFEQTTLKFTFRQDENLQAQLGAILDSVVGNRQLDQADFFRCRNDITREYEQNRADAEYQTAKFSFVSQGLIQTTPMGNARSLANINPMGAEDFLRGFYSPGHMAVGILSGAPLADLLEIASPVCGVMKKRAGFALPRITGDLLVLPMAGLKCPRIECYFGDPAPAGGVSERMVQILAELLLEGHIKGRMNSRYRYQLCNIVVSEFHLSLNMKYLYVKFDYLGGALGADEANKMIREIQEFKISRDMFCETAEYLKGQIHPPACEDLDYLLYNITHHYLYQEPLHINEADNEKIKNALLEITKEQVDRYLQPKLSGNARVVLSLPA